MKTSKTYSTILLLVLLGMAVGVTWVVAQSDTGYWTGDNIDHNGYLPIVLRQMGPEDEEMERNALIVLYQSTDGAGWENSDGWLGPETHCKWYGVGCVNGSVTDLDLHYNQVNGTIPKELGNLSNLKSLVLYSNLLNGSIPNEFGNISNLGILDLENNQLSGTIPKELGNLSNLEWLGLHYNQLSGPIPKELGNLSRMRGLSLSSNQLSSPIPIELGNLSSLESLYLFSNQLSGPIPKELGKLSSLGLLYLSYNQLSGPIPKELGNLDDLRGLDLRFNQLSCWETWEVLQWALGFGCAKYPWDPSACFDYPTPGETICP